MNVLVTGAAGFVGRHLVARLAARGDAVVALDHVRGDWPAPVRALAGDIADPAVRTEALSGCDAVVHLATVPGGAAEADPETARRINLDAGWALLSEAAATGTRPRFVFASSIAVLGTPTAPVDDDTPLAPVLLYGGHKAMIEQAVALFTRRGAVDGVSVRLPAILARPRAPSGLASAFLSEVFHALRAGEHFTCPVSPAGTIWAQSLACCTANLVHALDLDGALLPPARAVTLPAVRTGMAELVAAIAAACDTPPSLVDWQPDPAIEATFATQPPLATPAAEHAGFRHDGSLATLVARALETLSPPPTEPSR